MFVYENGNTLNITFKGNIPVENPEIVIKGYADGATVSINGTVYGSGSEEFEGKAKTFVYQKDGKLMITFNGIEGMSSPEITIDETSESTFDIVVGDTSISASITEDGVSVGSQGTIEPAVVEEEESTFEETIIPEEKENTVPESVDGEGDSDAAVEDL